MILQVDEIFYNSAKFNEKLDGYRNKCLHKWAEITFNTNFVELCFRFEGNLKSKVIYAEIVLY